MSHAQEVIESLRSYPTVFTCECGARLWHFDSDDGVNDKLTCEGCSKYMSIGFKTKPLAEVPREPAVFLSGVRVGQVDPFHPELWKA